MNQEEREHLARMMGILDSIPFPRQEVSQEAIRGLVTFSDDIRQIFSAMKALIEGICLQEQEDLSPDYDYQVPSKVLDAIDEWIKLRTSQDWGRSSDQIDDFYKYPEEE